MNHLSAIVCRVAGSAVLAGLLAVASTELQAQEIDGPVEKIFSGVKSTTSAAQPIVLRNTGTVTLRISSVSLVGTHPSSFGLVSPPSTPRTLAPGSSVTYNVVFKPGSNVGIRSAVFRVLSDAVDEPTLNVGLYGLSANGEQGSNEPTLNNIVKTLGYNINVGGTTLVLPTSPEPIGDEVLVPLFVKAGAGPVTMVPVARYSPDDLLDLGYYTRSGATLTRTRVATVALNYEQSLNPGLTSDSSTTFDPGTAAFGFYAGPTSYAPRNTYTEDSQNPPPAPLRHAVRIYPAKNRAGAPLENTYLVCMEPAKNGDYQDYVLVISNVKPPGGTPPVSRTFETEALLPAEATSGDPVRTLSEAAASGGATLMNDSNAVGDFVTLRLRSVAAGTYTVKARFKRHPSRGMVQVQLGLPGSALANVGGVIDLYASSPAYQEFTLGSWTMNADGDALISFRITAKNGSSTGFTQCIDRVVLAAP